MSQFAVELQAVYKDYANIHALKDINLSLKAGEVLGLFGHNGAGKSTLMKLILGLIAPSKGNVFSLGHCPRTNGSHHYKRQFGYLPEHVSFYDQLTGREVLYYFARLKDINKSEAEKLLAEVGLVDAADRAVKTYSKGMRQRLGLAQALLGDPKLLILDEPTVGLDPIAIGDFYTTVDQLKSQGCSLILCSHVLPGVEAHIDRAMILGQGKQLALGTIDDLRSETQLPIEIRSHGLSRDELGNPAENYVYNSSESPNVQKLLVPQEKKLSVLQQLMANKKLSDLEVKQPSLQEIYSYYMGGKIDSGIDSKIQNTKNNTGNNEAVISD